MTVQGECTVHHDWFTALLTFGLCCGLIISYAPQHYRIISNGTSLGLSPWFLLLGSTSTAAGLFNIGASSGAVVSLCVSLLYDGHLGPRFALKPFGTCTEISAGILQVGLQWLLFTMILVLYMIYYPPELKHEIEDTPTARKRGRKRDEWQTSIILAWIVAVCLVIVFGVTIYLLADTPLPPPPSESLPHRLSSWATFLGISSAILSAIQYAPQLIHTYNIGLVGALSIPMMMIQTPGAILMVLSIALRPGTNWTSWITFVVAGIMQGSLLIMCLAWKVRQRQLGVDDFGQPIGTSGIEGEMSNEETPLLRSATGY